ncbi:MAG: spermidine/putrescine transport system ATP-binding protein [Thermoleophilaceae bacterium]|nr:spermidine/putrescine transport system ATP-binding protein [Thermoleophilaceae bacterium]MEA2408693.1 spermidine/putrescine transport system ATP-binding protein [Thermoleophilaceae bacterium]
MIRAELTQAGVRQAAISLEGVTKRFGGFRAVDDVTLEIGEGEFFSLLGPSGCGKTTCLRMMAGFEQPDSGAVRLGSRDVTGTPANRRPVNLVFQSYELFPHMTVFDNVAFGLKIKRVGRTEIEARVTRTLESVTAAHLAARYPRELSGGQQQRIALARALVNEPGVLLLDEPLSALDVKLRKQMQQELKQIQHRLGTTFVYVTHDQEEAFVMSDRIAVMNEGRILQVAVPREIYERPATRFVADFVGSLNVFPFRMDERAAGLATMLVEDGQRIVAKLDASGRAATHLGVRPERIRVQLAETAEASATRLVGVVESIDYFGTSTRLQVATAAVGVVVCESANTGTAVPEQGERVSLTWDLDAAFGLPPEDAR